MAAMTRQLLGRCISLSAIRYHQKLFVPISSKLPLSLVRPLSSTPADSNDSNANKSAAVETTKQPKIKIEKDLYDRLVRSNKVVIFMKGTPKSPRCGFSNAVVQIFRMHGVQYDAHDVLANEELREGIKAYTDWPTIPQVFINGEFVGGCDILLEMHQNGDLIEQLQKAGIVSELLRLQEQAENKNKEGKNNQKK